MKIFAVFALVAVAVYAKSYSFRDADKPCAYHQHIDIYEDNRKYAQYDVAFNGRYMKVKAKSEEGDYLILLRPDIGHDKNATLLFFSYEECNMAEVEPEIAMEYLDTYHDVATRYVKNKQWDHKESKKYRGKQCDYYFDDDEDEASIYVYDEKIYGVIEGDSEWVIEYDEDVSMSDFALSKKDYPECVEQEKKLADKPSDDYVLCAAGSMKVAIIALFAALVSAFF